MFNPTITVEMVLAHNPCGRWTDDRLRSVLGDGMPLIDCLRLESVSMFDRIWLFAEVAPPRMARMSACDCAERALLRERAAGREPHKHSWDAIEVGRRYARGNATDEEVAGAADAAGKVVQTAWVLADWADALSSSADDYSLRPGHDPVERRFVADAAKAAFDVLHHNASYAAFAMCEWARDTSWVVSHTIELCEQWES